MSGGDVYEVRMRVKSGPKIGTIGTTSTSHIHFAVEHPKTIKYTAERERVLRESGTETIDTTPLGFDNNTGGVGKCTYKFLKRLAAHKYPGESCDTVRRQHAWISTSVMSIQCNLFKLLRWRFDQKLRLFRRANGLLSEVVYNDFGLEKKPNL